MLFVPLCASLIALLALTFRDVRRRDKANVPLANAIYNPGGARLIALVVTLALAVGYAFTGG